MGTGFWRPQRSGGRRETPALSPVFAIKVKKTGGNSYGEGAPLSEAQSLWWREKRGEKTLRGCNMLELIK